MFMFHQKVEITNADFILCKQEKEKVVDDGNHAMTKALQTFSQWR